MRTKSLLFTAALSAIGLSGAVGQVYSQNVVGYITLTLPKGLSIVANQLDNKNGNLLKDVIPTLPDGSTVHFFENGKYVSVGFFEAYDNLTKVFAVGAAAFVDAPLDSPADKLKITFVGEVAQGAASNSSIPNGLSMVASKTPRAGKLSTDLKFPSGANLDGSFLYKYNTTTKNFDTASIFGGWEGVEPTLAVGEGAFFLNLSGQSVAWEQNFQVN